MNFDPNMFARATLDDYDVMFGDKQPVVHDPEKEIELSAFLVFAHGPGARVLQTLVNDYLAKPLMNPALGLLNGTANGWIREGQNSVVREIIKRMEAAIEQQKNPQG